MNTLNVTYLIEVVAALMLPFTFGVIMWERYKRGRGPGARSIQLLTVCMVLPVTLILSLEKVLDGGTASALLGTLVGYVLSGVGQYEAPGPPKQPAKAEVVPD